MSLEKKYQALLGQAQQRDLADAQSMRLCFELLSLSSAIDRDCAARLAPHGLSEGRFVLLFLLDAAEGAALAPNALAEQAGISRATVTGLLDGLQREGLIERQPDAHDRRALRIVLTAQGRRTARKVIAQHSQWIAQLLAPLNSAERGQLQRLLGKIAAAMQEAAP
ncbi:MarR family winged helix-turn-helix transcriptional regulator [Vandammella animalimorsus]|uniref:MarR family transcriptional regulator n=1 Tax=Vandammella animalimorsus TaxID=2029117 RepID=A0A2A2AIB2_9BURK|nr:MarR family transcriptional regulator [Vandammella animalimorsus]PAT37484.1 MarR family transcriptional regulator [Vandammella animalimorsus]RMX17604.1 MarR family transcriptional regulator [Vandammella animalimorsus]